MNAHFPALLRPLVVRARSFLADLPLQTKSWSIAAILVSAFLVVVFVFHHVETEELRAEAAVARSLEVRAAVEQVLRLLLDSENGTRGYLLTGGKDWLRPYELAAVDVPEAL